ncbi:uncharacterized protein SPPG_02130 [Spizellomyces punctatus DAOM BR117]|uniref:FAR1 domain-containing protein n=1 Tax=Spizellomyces punctatus (strain DAOM BR117) TaxID=645134 RepID=A0A0L0HQ54_SPIPD|nr:uncharacterized protein SPPG_02130 [Spizellomyces punctatus DAOM BR117]KND03065.1 hypothetical protein SPPG_02130 [Spizellomyces punctatus DAOM BR117]|eukprot:XP_016611104.1 hypothetical protein SPPG_02130 [Spizellomyces punctatus DAOM BR117]
MVESPRPALSFVQMMTAPLGPNQNRETGSEANGQPESPVPPSNGSRPFSPVLLSEPYSGLEAETSNKELEKPLAEQEPTKQLPSIHSVHPGPHRLPPVPQSHYFSPTPSFGSLPALLPPPAGSQQHYPAPQYQRQAFERSPFPISAYPGYGPAYLPSFSPQYAPSTAKAEQSSEQQENGMRQSDRQLHPAPASVSGQTLATPPLEAQAQERRDHDDPLGPTPHTNSWDRLSEHPPYLAPQSAHYSTRPEFAASGNPTYVYPPTVDPRSTPYASPMFLSAQERSSPAIAAPAAESTSGTAVPAYLYPPFPASSTETRYYTAQDFKNAIISRTFDKKEVALDFIKEEAQKFGFSVLVRTSKPDYVVVICNCGRRLKKLQTERKRNRRFKTAMTGCEWRIVLFRNRNIGGGYEFRATPKMEHNHPLPVIPPSSV